MEKTSQEIEEVILHKIKIASQEILSAQIIRDMKFELIADFPDKMIARLSSYVMAEHIRIEEKRIKVPSTAWDSLKMHLRDKYPRIFNWLNVDFTIHIIKFEEKEVYPQLPIVYVPEKLGHHVRMINILADRIQVKKTLSPDYYEGRLDRLKEELDTVICDYSIEFPSHYMKSKWH